MVDDSAADRRYESRVEAAAYFCVAEATRGLGQLVEVTLTVVERELLLVVTGRNFGAVGLPHMRDRVEAAGGTITSRHLRHTSGTIMPVHGAYRERLAVRPGGVTAHAVVRGNGAAPQRWPAA